MTRHLLIFIASLQILLSSPSEFPRYSELHQNSDKVNAEMVMSLPLNMIDFLARLQQVHSRSYHMEVDDYQESVTATFQTSVGEINVFIADERPDQRERLIININNDPLRMVATTSYSESSRTGLYQQLDLPDDIELYFNLPFELTSENVSTWSRPANYSGEASPESITSTYIIRRTVANSSTLQVE